VVRTVTAPPTDRGMWRKLLRCVHPDAGGDDALFVWVRNLQEHVAGDGIEPLPQEVRRDPPRHPTTGDRIDYTEAFDRASSFDGLTRAAVMYADEVGAPHDRLLRMLRDCMEAGPDDVALHRQQNQGATYKSLAAIAHRAGMSKPERVRWYRIAESVPLSQRHAGHIIKRMQERAA
jgi:hypothetical protein